MTDFNPNYRSDTSPFTEEQTRVLGYCRSNRHGAPKRVNTWGPDGLLSFCKLCGHEVLFSWPQINEIQRTFEQKQEQAS